MFKSILVATALFAASLVSASEEVNVNDDLIYGQFKPTVTLICEGSTEDTFIVFDGTESTIIKTAEGKYRITLPDGYRLVDEKNCLLYKRIEH